MPINNFLETTLSSSRIETKNLQHLPALYNVTDFFDAFFCMYFFLVRKTYEPITSFSHTNPTNRGGQLPSCHSIAKFNLRH